MEQPMDKPNEWEAGPDEELKIPTKYITDLRYEITVFTPKKIFSFRCKDYCGLGNRELLTAAREEWVFSGVIIDSSKRDARGNVTLKRLSYHPQISLVNVPFMVIPAPEEPISEVSPPPAD